MAAGERESTWALLSDTHISGALDRTVRGACMAANLRRVVAEVAAAGPDHVLFNGDLAFARGKREDYAAFHELAAPLLERGTPWHVIPGNHDHRPRLCESLGLPLPGAVDGKLVSTATSGDAQWLFLDSLDETNAVRGSLGETQRAWLAAELASDSAPAVVCVHHNPEPSLVGLRDFQEFRQIVEPTRRVKLVFFGHTHEFRVWQSAGLHFVNLPATGFRFKPGTALGWVSARFTSGGARLVLRGVTPRERDHGIVHRLAWRSDA